MEAGDVRRFEQGRQLDRLNAFSDGIFAIAATLLVLTIDVPDGVSRGQLDDRLRDLREPLLAYFLSFAVVGLYWLRHHQLFGRMERSDPGIAALNLALLAFVALLPWPTDLLGNYPDASIAVAVYAGNILIIAVLLGALRRGIDARGLAHHPGEPHVGRRGLVVMAIFGASIPLAFVDPALARSSWLLVAIVPFVLSRTVWRKR